MDDDDFSDFHEPELNNTDDGFGEAPVRKRKTCKVKNRPKLEKRRQK